VSYRAELVANSVLTAARAADSQITHMKLQKLAYFAHGWHLALTGGDPLIREGIEAWRYGPVVYSIYRAFRDSGKAPITELAPVLIFRDGEVQRETPTIAEEDYASAVINRVWDQYGGYSAEDLSRMTHAPGTPWHRVFTECGGVLDFHADIPDELIRAYFSERLTGAVQQLQ
jgi:uncharacterized phage-associated protein